MRKELLLLALLLVPAAFSYSGVIYLVNASFVSQYGDTMYGNLDMNGNSIIGIDEANADTVNAGSVYAGAVYSGGNPVLTATPAERTIYVDNVNGDDTNGDGSEANPYKTVARAVQDIPDSITQHITVHLKASSTTYDGLSLNNKIFTDTPGILTFEGEMKVLETGTISSYVYRDSDPAYPSAYVMSITDNSKSWTQDEWQYKLLQIKDSSGNIVWRAIITNNTANKIYFSYEVYKDVTNYNYEILDWATNISYIDVRNIYGPLEFYYLQVGGPSVQKSVKFVHDTSVKFNSNRVDKYYDGGQGMYIQESSVSIVVDYFDGHKKNYDAIGNGYGLPSRIFMQGVVIKNFRFGMFLTGIHAFTFFRDGSRILSDPDNSIARGGIWLIGPIQVSFYSPRGSVVIDTSGFGIKGADGGGPMLQFDNYIVFGPQLSNDEILSFGLNHAGDFFAPTIYETSSHTPSSSSSACKKGQFAWDSNYFYICVSDNTWKRVSLSSW